MARENILSQETVELKGSVSLVLLVTRCVARGATVTVDVPALANTGTGTQPGSRGTTRTEIKSAAVLLDHGEVSSEVVDQASGVSTAPTVTAAAGANSVSGITNTSDRDSVVTIVSGSGTAFKTGDTFTLVTLHRKEDLTFTQEKFQ